jgi:hypothetical protein
MLTATVSGSFRRHMDAITSAVHELSALSVRVLSPADPRVVAADKEFLFVASDPTRSVRLVQDRHFESIRASDFLWLVCPDRNVGQSSCLEIGFATSCGVPVLATLAPGDMTLQQYVRVVPSLRAAVTVLAVDPPARRHEGGVLIDPKASIEHAHAQLERIGFALAGRSAGGNLAGEVYRDAEDIRRALALPTRYLQ